MLKKDWFLMQLDRLAQQGPQELPEECAA